MYQTKKFARLRERMIEEQIKMRGIKNERVLKAFEDVPRECFVPRHLQEQAYMDRPLSIGEGQTISQPYTVAFMTELLDLKGDEKVLEIGTGSGYGAAILSKLCKIVYTVEVIPILAKKARDRLRRLNIKNVIVIVSDGSIGLKEKAPFDAISVTAAAPEVPSPLVRQLKEGGRLVVPVGGSFSQQMLKIIKEGDGVRIENHGGFRFVPLVGEFGWRTSAKDKGIKRMFKEKT